MVVHTDQVQARLRPHFFCNVCLFKYKKYHRNQWYPSHNGNNPYLRLLIFQEKEARVKEMKEQMHREMEDEERKMKLDKEAAIK